MLTSFIMWTVMPSASFGEFSPNKYNSEISCSVFTPVIRPQRSDMVESSGCGRRGTAF